MRGSGRGGGVSVVVGGWERRKVIWREMYLWIDE